MKEVTHELLLRATPGSRLVVRGRPAEVVRRRDVHVIVRYVDAPRVQEVLDPFDARCPEVEEVTE